MATTVERKSWIGTANPVRVHVRKDKTNPRRLAYLTLFMFAVPPSWPLMTVGSVLVIAGVILHGWAAGYLARAGYEEREKVLTVRGPYRHNRNPYYLAHLTMDLGFFCVAGLPLLYLVHFPVIFAVYRRWVSKEEAFLEAEFGESYVSLKGDVPRWRFRLTPAPPRGPAQSFKWATFLLNRELSRSLRHVILLGVLTLYFLFGNPFERLDVFARITGIGAVAVWLALRDIQPVQADKISAPWVIAAASAAALVIAALVTMPVWEVWPESIAWGAVVAGSCLGLFVSATASPMFSHVTGRTLHQIVSRPMSQLYVAGFALGLLTCTYGGVWAGLAVPLVLWALGIAGIVALRAAPQRTAVGLGMAVVFVAVASMTMIRLMD